MCNSRRSRCWQDRKLRGVNEQFWERSVISLTKAILCMKRRQLLSSSTDRVEELSLKGSKKDVDVVSPPFQRFSRMRDEDPYFEGKATILPDQDYNRYQSNPSIFYPRAGLIVLGLGSTYRLSFYWHALSSFYPCSSPCPGPPAPEVCSLKTPLIHPYLFKDRSLSKYLDYLYAGIRTDCPFEPIAEAFKSMENVSCNENLDV